MRRLLIFLGCIALWLACAARCVGQPVLTTIQDTLYNLDGSPTNGSIILTHAAFSVGGVPAAHGTRTFPINNGVANIQLAPTDHATPAVAYAVSTVASGRLFPVSIRDLHDRASHDDLHAGPDNNGRTLTAFDAGRDEWAARLRQQRGGGVVQSCGHGGYFVQ